MGESIADLLAQGRGLEARGDREGASATYQRAILAHPADPVGYIHLGNMLYVGGLLDEARQIFAIGMRQVPGSPLLHWAACMAELPMVYSSQDEIGAARSRFAERLLALRTIGFANEAAIEEAGRAVGLISPFFLPYGGGDVVDLMRDYGDLVVDIMAANQPGLSCRPVVPVRAGEKIRIGVVSGLFWRHSVWRMPMRGWVKHIDRARFEIIGYQTRDNRDAETDRAAILCDRFTSGHAPLRTWIDRIQDDSPHVLIYPELGIDQTSVQLAALRLAPLQCTGWGQPVTSGLPTIDAYLSSAAMEPPDADAQYTERLVRLPGLGIAYDPRYAAWDEALPAEDVWAGFGVPADAVRILCCQATQKYLPRYDDIFPRIGAAVPNARFVFINQNQRNTDLFWRRLHAAFAAHGLAGEAFCLFVPALTPGGFSGLVRDAHLYLDTPEWSGCNTTLDALNHHVPIVTLPGGTMRARHGLAILSEAGVTETIARSVMEFEQISIRLAHDPALRRSVSERLRAGKARLFADRSGIRGLEEFLTRATA